MTRATARGRWRAATAAFALTCALAGSASAQDVRIRDLTMMQGDVPLRLMGYGLVVGLDGTGDRVAGGRSSRHTVQSVANLLRRFDIEVPAEMLRTRNVAAVLVTAELSPYLRPGGRFDIHVASVGDARSLKGGVLWMTPLVSEVGEAPVASAQGPLIFSEAPRNRWNAAEGAARIPAGGVLEAELPRPRLASTSRLLLRHPELATATRIAAAINDAFGTGAATVEDPGSVSIHITDSTVAENGGHAMHLARIGELRVSPHRAPTLVIDSRNGTIVAGGEIAVGEAMVTHAGITLSIGGESLAGDDAASGNVRAGASAHEIASALRAMRTPPTQVAGVFEALRQAGALSAEIVVR
jgi:flagellar P-ring protein precursor FlgI